MNKLILIGVPNGSGFFPAIMVSSLLTLRKPAPCAFYVVERQMIEKARNAICFQAMQNNATHILFVDDDNPIPEDTLEKMLEDDKDIVIAPILARNPDQNGVHKLCAFDKEVIDGVNIYRNKKDLPKDDYLHKIDAGGTGCMLIKIDVIKKMNEVYPNRWFESTRQVFDKPIMVDGGVFTERTMSEDVQFCERAIELGFEVWLDSRIRPLHIAGNNYVQWQLGT